MRERTLAKLKSEKAKIEKKIKELEQKESVLQKESEFNKFLKSDSYLKLKTEVEQLFEDAKNCLKKEEFVLTLPIRFTVKNNKYYQHCSIMETCAEDIVELDFEAKLDGDAKKLKLTTSQHAMLQSGIKAVVEDACEDIIKILPKPLMDKVRKIQNRITELQSKVYVLEDKYETELDL